MNPNLDHLHPYPFEKLNALKQGCTPPQDTAQVLLSVGEPRHPPPEFVLEALAANLEQISTYPSTRGSEAFRVAVASWLNQRFALSGGKIDPEKNILPVNGTREALFAIAQCVLDSTRSNDQVLMPNPFYQIYEGAAALAGLKAAFYNTDANSQYAPDFDCISDAEWDRCQLLYLCTPANPSGHVLESSQLQQLVERAHRHNFVIASDECYSEIYFDEASPPCGLLQACSDMAVDDFSQCVVFHSLSKRSNLPGLRSGFVAGDSKIIDQFLRYRTYHGCAMSQLVQNASTLAWQDESHVVENRQRYRDKFSAVLPILDGVEGIKVHAPQASFYLWPELAVDDEKFTQTLYNEHNITVLPGRYLARNANGANPGENHIRIALVAELESCIDAATRIRQTLEKHIA
ncbi:MAG: succinyldiaminopimelate transaminase [Pseudomonadota bacterium]